MSARPSRKSGKGSAFRWWRLQRSTTSCASSGIARSSQATVLPSRRVYTRAIGAVAVALAIGGTWGACVGCVAFLSLAAFDTFIFGMVAGRGWICIALVFFSSWRPWRAFAGALMFAAFDALQLRQQQQANQVIPYQFFLAMPYVLSIVVLAMTSRGLNYPRALFQPFRRSER